MPILASLCLALAPSLPVQSSDASLEDFLRRTRAAQAAQLEALAPRLEPLLKALASKKGFKSNSKAAREEILGMGPAVAPLLLRSLLPTGEAEQVIPKTLLSNVKGLLIELRPGGINKELFELASTGQAALQLLAVEVLGHVSNAQGVVPFLTRIFQGDDSKLQTQCLKSLALQGGPASLGLLRRTLNDAKPELRQAALEALAAARDRTSAPAVLQLISEPQAAGHMTAAVLAYYQGLPDVVDSDVVRALGRLVVQASAKPEAALPLLEALPDLPAARKTRDLRQLLEPLKKSPDPEVRDAALVCLHLLGDRQVKKTLLRTYDAGVKRDPRFYQAYASRGDMYLRMREYNSAIKDYREALDLINNTRNLNHKRITLNLARCLALSGKLGRAASTLQSLSLGKLERRALAGERAFRELVASSRYGKVLQ